ncbi:MAG: hypothetical protein CMG41_05795 [Candidatus Marinimicrobia bacterium]|nr:hypothetical protein [Candidatus Neomarinimicrobiota bacterium]|tara:strand:- start:1155 stop:1547 length:393 start_codon:yes stop_codon:yes gene_type:complete
MNPQLVLTVIGAINILMGIAIYIGAENIVTGGAFNPELIKLNPSAVKVGTYMHEALAAFMIAFGFVALLNRDMEDAPAKKLLFAMGVAYVINLTSVVLHIINPEVNPPVPAVIIMLALTVAAFYTSKVSD